MKNTSKHFQIPLTFVILAAALFTSMPAAHALSAKTTFFVFGPNPAAGFNGAVDIVWISVVASSTYGKFTMAFYRDSDDHGTHWFTENLDAGDAYADLTEAVYPTEQPKESVAQSEIDIVLEGDYLKAVVKVSGEAVFTAEFWVDENAVPERSIESSPNDADGFFSFSLRRPLVNAKVQGLDVVSFAGGFYDDLDIELYDSHF